MKVNVKDELLKRLSDLIGDMKWASTLVEDGKEIPCYRKLQGARTKALNIVELIRLIPDDLQVMYETLSNNVAKANTQK